VQLADVHELCERYLPTTSRPLKARSRSTSTRAGRRTSWGHLLTVPRASIGLPLFGMDVNVSPFHPSVTTWWAYELAAMSISRRLLIACGRADLFFGAGGELESTDWNLREYGSRGLALRILRRRCVLRLPRDRAALETMLANRTEGSGS